MIPMRVGRPDRRKMNAVRILLCLAVGLIVSAASLTASAHAAEQRGAFIPGAALPAETGGEFVQYLPMVFNKYNAITLYGVEMTTATPGQVMTLVEEMGSDWIRHNALLWSAIEPANNVYDWTGTNAQLTDIELAATAEAGMRSVLIVRSTPEWARLYPDKACGPMQAQYFDDFGQFLVDVLARYSVAPYNLRYLEIWNEPDVAPSDVAGDQIFGCWGDKNDTYYGGRYFGDMLKVVYPMIKNAYPETQVMVGGLLLDCDPRNPPPGKTCKESKFLEGILVAGAKNSFDGVSFHAYDYYNSTLDTFGNPNWNSGRFNGEVNGILQPVLVAKAGFIREVLNAQGATGKFLMNSESGLLCGGAFDPPGGAGCEAEDDSPFEQMKKAYLAQAYASAGVQALRANLWFTITGWRNTGLVYPDKTPRPAYFAFQFSESMLWDAAYYGTVVGYPKVTGYKYLRTDGTKIWVMWANDGLTKVISLLATPLAIWDATGTPIAVSGKDVSVSVSPVYIKMP